MKINCPSCGAEVSFKSKSSIFSVCSFCNSTLVRHDLQIDAIGKMSDMPSDLSQLQVGSCGIYEGSKFEIVGRQKIKWSDGFWNEWYLYFDNGKEGWLAEAQGLYMISFQHEYLSTMPKITEVAPGKNILINKSNFEVNDIKQIECIASQGELPIKSLVGRKSTSVDLCGPNELFANIDFGSDEVRLFVGKYKEFEELRFMNLRELDGW